MKPAKMNEKETILAKLLPEINCPPGCSLCCNADLALVYDYEECSSYENGKCIIFESRPFTCRFFFKGKDDPCCLKGLKPDNGGLKPELMRQIIWCWTSGTINDAKAIYASWR